MTLHAMRRLVHAGSLAGLLALSALPAMAQRSLLSDDNGGRDRPCMTDHMLRNFLASNGFTNISLNVSRGVDWPAKGTKDGQVHRVTVDTCARRIFYQTGR